MSRGYVQFQQILRETKSKSAKFRIRWSKVPRVLGPPNRVMAILVTRPATAEPCPKLSLTCISLLYFRASPYKLYAQCAVHPGATCRLQFAFLIYLSASFRMCQLCVICHCLWFSHFLPQCAQMQGSDLYPLFRTTAHVTVITGGVLIAVRTQRLRGAFVLGPSSDHRVRVQSVNNGLLCCTWDAVDTCGSVASQ